MMRRRTKVVSGIGFCALICMGEPGGAFGQTGPSPFDLFERGKELMNAGDYAAACPMLQQSYDLAPMLGVLHTLATCRDREGSIATALTLYRDYLTRVAADSDPATQEKHAVRVTNVTERVRQVQPEVPKLKLVWHGEMPKGVEVDVGGVDALPQISAEWPLDPGDYIVTIRRKGSAEETRRVKLESGKPVVEVDLTPAPPEPLIKKNVQPIAKQSIPERRDPFLYSQRTVGGILFVVAGAGGIAAAALGIKAASMKADVNDGCEPVNAKFNCTPVGRIAAEETYAWGQATTWTLVASGAFAMVGAIEWGRGAPKKESRHAAHMRLSVGQKYGFVMVEGRF